MKKPTPARTPVTLSIVLGLAVLNVTLGHTQSRRAMTTEADYHQAMDELSNWGRWGADDFALLQPSPTGRHLATL